jgi:peptidyl-prolyl cis-trans isomerase SurA
MIMKFNKKGKENLTIVDSTWYNGSDQDIDKMSWTTGLHSFNWKGYPALIVIKEKIDPVPLPFEKVKGEMLSGFQDKLEKDWIKQLKEKYTVKVDSNEFSNLKKKLINE